MQKNVDSSQLIMRRGCTVQIFKLSCDQKALHQPALKIKPNGELNCRILYV